MMMNVAFLIFGAVVLIGAFVGWKVYSKEYCKEHKTWRKKCGCK